MSVPYIIIIKIIIRSIKVAGYYFLSAVCSTFSVDFSILPGKEFSSSGKSAASLFFATADATGHIPGSGESSNAARDVFLKCYF
jgi:hypothetical protein